MKNSFFLTILLIIISSCSSKMNNYLDLEKEPHKKCEIITVLLNVEELNNFIKEHEKNYSIRINDLSGFFKKVDRCGYDVRYFVKFNSKLSVDLNTSRFIDISILSFKKLSNEKYKFEIFYSPQTESYHQNYLKHGNIEIQHSEKGWIVTKSNFVLVD